eukprot:GHUV01048073.1.p1 GENE.GHUV01048073.1~~GHUV01048073.1.p1  ORF type:complete len:144 (+),score=22.57 GHUV01048073.1:370-801(+)
MLNHRSCCLSIHDAGVAADNKVVLVQAQPSNFELPVNKAALVMIDFQKDFMCEGGFGAALGNDVKQLQSCVPGAARLLAACRAAGMKVIHTLEGHKPDLSDLHLSKVSSAVRWQLTHHLRSSFTQSLVCRWQWLMKCMRGPGK